MKKEELTALGLTEEQAASVFAINGKDIEATKAKYADYDDVKTQLSDANKAIEDFKGMDIEGVKKSAEEYKAKFEQAEADATKKMSELQFSHALDAALSGAKSKNAKAVKALLDMDGLKQNGDDIVGLKEQLEKIKTENSYLFDDETPAPTFTTQTSGGGSVGESDTLRKAMGLPPIKE